MPVYSTLSLELPARQNLPRITWEDQQYEAEANTFLPLSQLPRHFADSSLRECEKEIPFLPLQIMTAPRRSVRVAAIEDARKTPNSSTSVVDYPFVARSTP